MTAYAQAPDLVLCAVILAATWPLAWWARRSRERDEVQWWTEETGWTNERTKR